MKPGSKGWKKFMAKLYGLGAAVVILGAMFKIMHWPGAGPMLVIGLTTEAFIFFFSAFEPLHEDPDWSLVYPELAAVHDDEQDTALEEGEEGIALEDKGPITEQLDNMLEEAKIGPELIESLGSGLRNLSDNASKLGSISDASVATNEYAESLRGASSKVGELSESYARATEAITGISASSEVAEATGQHMEKMSQNLAALNNVYETQLKGTSEHMEATNQLAGGIRELMQNLNDSIEDTKQYKDSIAELSKNLTALNTVYGNMLTAMNFRQDA